MRSRPSTWTGDDLDADAKWPGGWLQTSNMWVRLPPASLCKQGFHRAGPAAPSAPVIRLAGCVPWMDCYEGAQDRHKVSSVGRAPDLTSGCHGFDSRTAPQANNLLPNEENRRNSVTKMPKGSERSLSLPRVVVFVSTNRAASRQHIPALCSAWIPLSRTLCRKVVETACGVASTARDRLTGGNHWKMRRT